MINLEEYGVSKETGFVPPQASLQLPHHYKPWEDLATALSIHLKNGTFLQQLDLLPALGVEHLHEEHEWQRAHIVLAFPIHALVHGFRRTTVPAVLADPFLIVCNHLGVKPVLSYAGLCIFNWSRGDSVDVLEGLVAEMTFTGTLDEAAFYLVPVLVELVGGQLPALMLQTLVAAYDRDWLVVTRNLEICSKTIQKMIDTLAQLKLCDPQVFYHQVRPYIAGLDVDFEKKDNTRLHVKLVGGSAAQSSTMPFLDWALGVSHRSQLVEEMKVFMPGGHRRLLNKVATTPSLQDVIENNDAPLEVRESLATCRNDLQAWRSRHIAIVTRYIVLPAQTAAKGKVGETAAVTGTAGSSPILFLKEMRDDTPLQLEADSPRHTQVSW